MKKGPEMSTLSLTVKDKFVKRCRAITERISEETSEIEGEWLTVADMKNLNFSEFLS